MMALDLARLLVRRCSGCLVLLLIAAAMSWVSPGRADESVVWTPSSTDESPFAPFDLNSLPFPFIITSDQDNFRGGTMTWEPTGNGTEVAFTVKVCFTLSDFLGGSNKDRYPCPGDIIFDTNFCQLFFADDRRFDRHTRPLFFLVTRIDKGSDVLDAVALRPQPFPFIPDPTKTTIPY